jgi:hypothetical protein
MLGNLNIYISIFIQKKNWFLLSSKYNSTFSLFSPIQPRLKKGLYSKPISSFICLNNQKSLPVSYEALNISQSSLFLPLELYLFVIKCLIRNNNSNLNSNYKYDKSNKFT